MSHQPSTKSETGCCPKFNPEPWDKKERTWDNKQFIKDHIISFLHMPLNFGKVMTRNSKKIDQAGALPEEKIWLTDETSLWGSDLYIAVEKDIPDAEMTSISGTFLTTVHQGPYGKMRSWVAEAAKYTESKNKKAKKLYFFYTTCPKCAKHYGKNYVVILSQVE